MTGSQLLISEIKDKQGESIFLSHYISAEGVLTVWVSDDKTGDLLRYLKSGIRKPFSLLYDLTAVDERRRSAGLNQPDCDFSVVYHLTSFGRNEDIRIKVPLKGEYPSVTSITGIWPCANWYEREIYDMFGITFAGHPYLRRLLMPKSWEGYPLRKEYPARATELGPFVFEEQIRIAEDEDLKFDPSDWGMETGTEDTDFMFLNLGPQHPGTHGLLRLVIQLDGEDIIDVVPDIGFHHGERRKWAKGSLGIHIFRILTGLITWVG